MRLRKAWQLVLRAMRRHEFDVLLVHKLDRLHRHLEDQYETISIAKHAGVEVISVADGIDKSNKLANMIIALIGLKNEMEWETTRERTMAGNRARAERGYPLVGKKPPYGHTWDVDTVESKLTGAGKECKTYWKQYEPEARVVRAYWDWFDTHPDEGYESCCTWLNSQGIPSPMGKRWRATTLCYLMHNPLYWGEGESFRSHREEVPERDIFGQVEMIKRARPRPADAALPRVRMPAGSYEPIVSKEQAMRVLSRIELRRPPRQSARLKNPEASC